MVIEAASAIEVVWAIVAIAVASVIVAGLVTEVALVIVVV